MNYETVFKKDLVLVEASLAKELPEAGCYPALLHEAMHYSVFPAGKRFRPVLAMAACEAGGGNPQEVVQAASAIEFIHCYSLVHDDLPSLDNDDLRRGKPTCHKKYGEAMAILAGDALLTLAFEVLSRVRPATKAAAYLAELSTAAGSCGMIGGQVADLTTGPEELNLPQIDFISVHKTGKLIRAAAVFGAIAAGLDTAAKNRMTKFGEILGIAFQAVDDYLDKDGYNRVMKPKELKQRIQELLANARRELQTFGKKAKKLHQLTNFLEERMK